MVVVHMVCAVVPAERSFVLAEELSWKSIVVTSTERADSEVVCGSKVLMPGK